MDRLINEQAVIDAIDKWVKSEGVLIVLPATKVTPLFDSIHSLPPVTPQPKTGHWIHLRADMYECSECGCIHTSFEIGKCDADYCPKCGSYNGGI